MNNIKIIIGLGNPGRKYTNTPHNIGFEIVDTFAEKNNFPDFKLAKKFKASISEQGKTILVKPDTFMNESGQSVKAFKSFYKTENIIIIHDDIDLPLGKIKIAKDSGSAGHKGVKSIIKELGTKEFMRIRIGVESPSDIPTEKYVLKKFNKEQRELLKPAIQETMEIL